MEEEILTVAEAAKYLGLSKRFVYQLIEDKILGCYLIGDRPVIRVGTNHLQEYLQKHEVTRNEHERIEEAA